MKDAMSPFLCHDETAERNDLREREEVKYVFPGAKLAQLRQVLRRTCKPIVYAKPVSEVYSLYFDDPKLGTCFANLNGVGLRHKSRLRWYDSPKLGDVFFAETKWRRHRVVGKKRIRVDRSQCHPHDSTRTIYRSLVRSLPNHLKGHWLRDSDPIAVVQYKREHFALDGTSARLTLDYDIRFYPMKGQDLLRLRFPQRLPEIALIECKTDRGDRGSLEGALKPLRARPTRFSKYVAACQQLGYAPVI